MDLFIKSNFVNDQVTENIGFKKLAFQWLNKALHMGVYFSKQFVNLLALCFVSRPSVAESFTIGAASRCVSEIIDVNNFCFTFFKPF